MFTSIHIEEFELRWRDTKRGSSRSRARYPERLERRSRISTRKASPDRRAVRQGDILVGKVTPKGDQELSPESVSSGDLRRQGRRRAGRVAQGAAVMTAS